MAKAWNLRLFDGVWGGLMVCCSPMCTSSANRNRPMAFERSNSASGLCRSPSAPAPYRWWVIRRDASVERTFFIPEADFSAHINIIRAQHLNYATNLLFGLHLIAPRQSVGAGCARRRRHREGCHGKRKINPVHKLPPLLKMASNLRGRRLRVNSATVCGCIAASPLAQVRDRPSCRGVCHHTRISHLITARFRVREPGMTATTG